MTTTFMLLTGSFVLAVAAVVTALVIRHRRRASVAAFEAAFEEAINRYFAGAFIDALKPDQEEK
ncbi:hypothetical protein AB0I81_39935 [Nonomuraea sp. NPDC050404]|uniref:hypothetical protein n=1 Tax=Nonomuraea sp. NPDC050404 TaxID=3155783 RepID=UPI003403D4F4